MLSDIVISGTGFYSVLGQTEDGREWLSTHVEGFDGTYAHCDSTAYTRDIADGAVADGLLVEVNDQPYRRD